MARRTPAQYDWAALRFDETILRKHFTAPRRGKIKFVVVHHMTIIGKGDGSANDACYNVWQKREASAHYGVDGNHVRQFVWDGNAAWSTGNSDGNHNGISIEHANSTTAGWKVSETTWKTGAKLAAHLHKAYGLGRPVSGKTLRRHRDFFATACPGPYIDSIWGEYVKEAQRVYDQITKGTPTPPTPQPKHTKWYSASFLNLWGDDNAQGTKTYATRLPQMVAALTKGTPDVVTGCECRDGAQAKALRKAMSEAGYPIGVILDGNFAFFRAGTQVGYSGSYILPKKVQGGGRKEALLRVRAKVNGHWLHVGVTHLDYRPGAKFDTLRVKQAKSVIAAMRRFGVRYLLPAKHRWLIVMDSNSRSWVRDKAMIPAGFAVAAEKGIDEAHIGRHSGRPVLASSSTTTASDHPVLHFTIGKKE